MTNFFLIVAEQSLRLSGMILSLWVLRTLLRRIPGSALYLLWILVFAGLLFPFRVEVPYHTEAPASAAEVTLSTEDPEKITASPSTAVDPPASQEQPAAPQNQRAGQPCPTRGSCMGGGCSDFGVHQRLEAGRLFPAAARRPPDRAGSL